MTLISRKVVVLIAAAETQYALRHWAQAAGFDLGTDYDGNLRDPLAFDFHVTLVASANEVFVPETQHQTVPISCRAVGFDVLGVDRRVPALRLAPSDDLALMRGFFVRVYGIEPTFAEYKPHVSLSYAWDGVPDIDALDLPDAPLLFDQLRVKTLVGSPAKAARTPRWPRKGVPGAHGAYR